MTSAPEPCVSPVDGPQHDYATTTPQPNIEIEQLETEHLSDISVAKDATTPQKKPAGENSPPPQENPNNHDALAPTSPTPQQEIMLAKSSSDLSVAGPPATPLKEITEESSSALQKEHKCNHTPTPIPATPTQSEVISHHVTTVSTTATSTLCQGKLGEGTPSAPKRPHSPSPPPPTPTPTSDSADPEVLALRRDYVFVHTFHGLKGAWQEVLELCGMRIGSRPAFHIRFEPDIDHIKQEVMQQAATLQEIADITELVLLGKWKEACRRIIIQYRLDMRRDMVSEALHAAQSVKDKVLARAAKVTADHPHPTPSPPRTPSQPLPRHILFPRTPGRNYRAAHPEVETLRPRIARLDIEDRYLDIHYHPYATPSPARRRRLDVSEEPHDLPRALSTGRRPRYGRNFRGTPGFRRLARTPVPRMATPSPAGSQVVGRIGPYQVTTPTASRPTVEGSSNVTMSEDDVFTSHN
ncbi:hypothetical protein F5Y06DRAFT_304096 [Hypoxylon sp. FL0890]|nr:hypothetical protein F5Y06DRAFT_304096 [Hypoxylon sp. FL0890]